MKLSALVSDDRSGDGDLADIGGAVELAAHLVAKRDLWPSLAQVARESEWIWLLQNGARPTPGALEALLHHLEGRSEEPVLLCGSVVDAAGDPIPRFLPRPPKHAPDVLVGAVARRELPMRWTPLTHALVHRSAVLEHGVPDGSGFGPFAPIEWSARVLRTEVGWLVPASIAVADPKATGPVGAGTAVRSALRLVRAEAWSPGEAVAEAFNATSLRRRR